MATPATKLSASPRKSSVDKPPVSVFPSDAWARYEATLIFTGYLVGGSPSDPKLVEGWMAKNLGITNEDELRRWVTQHMAEIKGIDPAAATDADIEAALAEAAGEKKAQVFKRTIDGKPYIEGRHVKAMLKEATSIAYPRGAVKFGMHPSTSEKKRGSLVGGKDAKAYVAERVFPSDEPIVVGDDVDGVELAVGHIREWSGETRSTIGYFEYVDRPTIAVAVLVLDDCLTAEQWARIWTVAEHNGLGARRSQGAGQFVVTAWERVS